MKKWLIYVSLGLILLACVFAVTTEMAGWDRSYEGHAAAVPVYELQQNPAGYDDSFASGAADAIVQQNLSETRAVNDVTSIVFDFRGYDTMGEAFILVTAVTGSAVILYKKKAGKEDGEDE